MLKEESTTASELGLDAKFVEGFKIKGWDGEVDQRDAAVFGRQATFHPTKYVIGILKWLKEQPKFQGYARTRAMNVKENGLTVPAVNMHLGSKGVTVETLGGQAIICNHAVEATCVPLQKLSVIAEMEYMRTYCIAIRIPKGSVEDCLIYDQAEA
ncbi:MAG: hypothetical protein M1823_008222, partial [Watsoniomyces obsoletus]